MYSFKELMVMPVEPGEDEYLKYRAMKRRKHMYEETAVEEETTDEALSMAARRKRSRDMRKNKNKLRIARNRMKKRVANPERIRKRAKKQAIDKIYKKLTKGMSRKDLTPAKKAELEKRIAKMKPRVNRIAKKLLPSVRRAAHGQK
tara:strand:- start:2482 stop:2919 length:438 start_codon:yes stop_codon:yes gene_type:complete